MFGLWYVLWVLVFADAIVYVIEILKLTKSHRLNLWQYYVDVTKVGDIMLTNNWFVARSCRRQISGAQHYICFNFNYSTLTILIVYLTKILPLPFCLAWIFCHCKHAPDVFIIS